MLLISFSWQLWKIFQLQKDSPICKSSHSFEVAELRLAPRSSDSNSFPVSKLGVNPPPEDAPLPVLSGVASFPADWRGHRRGLPHCPPRSGRKLPVPTPPVLGSLVLWTAWGGDAGTPLPPVFLLRTQEKWFLGVWLSRGEQFPPKLED